MPSTPIQRLAKALCAATSGGKPGEVVALARSFGIDGRAARDGAAGKYITASDYLRLCGALGIDPVTEERCTAEALPDIDWDMVKLRVRIELVGTPEDPRAEKLPMRRAAKEWGVPLVVLGRMKAGEPASIDNLLALCAAFHCHPHAFLKSVPPPDTVKQEPERIDLSQIASRVLA